MKRVLILGRFQPPHLGHLHAIESAAKRADEVIVVVGSAQESFTSENPFTAGERIEMLGAALKERKVDNVLIVPLADLHRHSEWVAYVASWVPPFDEVVTNNPLTKQLFGAAGYKVRVGELWSRANCSGTKIRARLASGKPVDALVGPAVRKILNRIRAPKRLKELAPQEPHGERATRA